MTDKKETEGVLLTSTAARCLFAEGFGDGAKGEVKPEKFIWPMYAEGHAAGFDAVIAAQGAFMDRLEAGAYGAEVDAAQALEIETLRREYWHAEWRVAVLSDNKDGEEYKTWCEVSRRAHEALRQMQAEVYVEPRKP